VRAELGELDLDGRVADGVAVGLTRAVGQHEAMRLAVALDDGDRPAEVLPERPELRRDGDLEDVVAVALEQLRAGDAGHHALDIGDHRIDLVDRRLDGEGVVQLHPGAGDQRFASVTGTAKRRSASPQTSSSR
jgi:hypothetical protein